MTEEQKKLADSLFWWHRIKLTEDYTTPGECPHGTGEDIESRFGLPKSLKGKSVLDVGAWDGLFSFEAERRGARDVFAIDIYQTCKGKASKPQEANKAFRLAKRILNSTVEFNYLSLEQLYNQGGGSVYDYIFYFGVLYHLKDPLRAIEQLSNLIDENGIVLLETTITDIKVDKPILEYRPGFDNDVTNQFYPNHRWIKEAFQNNGAKTVELIWSDNTRSSFKISY